MSGKRMKCENFPPSHSLLSYTNVDGENKHQIDSQTIHQWTIGQAIAEHEKFTT